jgi:hydrogenase maturation protease
MAPFHFDTVVVGVGNTILSDDGVGVHAARALMQDPRLRPGVPILDGGTLGLELLGYISDARRILFLDAVDSGAAPGTLVRMTGRDLLDGRSRASVHQLGVADLIAAIALVSGKDPEIVVLGVQPATVDWGTSLSPAVHASVARLVEAALDQLRAWQPAAPLLRRRPRAAKRRPHRTTHHRCC